MAELQRKDDQGRGRSPQIGKVNYWIGPKGTEFEKQFAAWQGSKYADSASTGTSALHIALTTLRFMVTDERKDGKNEG